MNMLEIINSLFPLMKIKEKDLLNKAWYPNGGKKLALTDKERAEIDNQLN